MEKLPIRLIFSLATIAVLACGLGILSGRAAPLGCQLLWPANPVAQPAPNSHTAPPTTTISITYDEPISPTSVSPDTFAVHAMQTGQLLQTYGVHGGTVVLTPSQPLKAGEWVQTSATTGLLSLIDGQGPISPTVWQFRTAVARGSGLFADSGQRLGDSSSRAVALGDLDGDADLDAFVANYAGQADRVWLNDGTGAFSDSGQSLGDDLGWCVALGDVEADGDLDAFVGNWGQPNRVWLNDGTGAFSDSGQALGDQVSNGVALGDLDADGDLDAFVANGSIDPANQVWFNDGTGLFSDSGQSLGTYDSRDVALGDVDGDGDLDAFVVNNDFQPNVVWLNDGAGGFSDSGQSLGASNSHAVDLGDVDGDGDLDAVVANFGASQVWLNDGTGHFTDGQSLGNAFSRDVALGDVDGDGDLDAWIANEGGQANTVWLNDGAGSFGSNGQELGDSYSMSVALGDVNGNGDLDAFVANFGANLVWLNATADLSLTKTATLPVVRPGQAVTYSLTYLNLGPGRTGGVVISDLVPITLTDISFSYSGPVITPTGNLSYIWQVADLEPGQGGTITLTGQISPAVGGLFELLNRATIGATAVDTDTSNNTAVVSITVDAVPPEPPALLSPPNWTVTSTNPLTLTWAPSPSPDVAGYWLLLDWGFIDVGNVTEYNTGILPELTHAWTLAAYDLAGNSGPYTDTWYFVIEDVPPEPPSLLSPPDGTLTSTNPLTLTWSASPSPDVAGYLVNLGGAVTDVGDVTAYPTPLLTDGAYTWTVAAYDLGGQTSPYADAWSFAVDTVPPEAPALLGPPDGTLTSTKVLSLTWTPSPSPDAAGYWLDFNGDVTDAGDVTAYTPAPLADGVYTWTVAAYDSAGNASPYAAPWSFEVDATPPGILALAPGYGQMDVALDAPVVITFSEAIDTDTFDYRVTPDPGGWSAAWDADDAVVSLDHAPFADQSAYTFTVDAADDLAGNPLLNAPVAWPFTTVSTPCTPVTGVNLSRVSTGTVYAGEAVAFQADVSPDEATKPYTYTVSVGGQTAVYPTAGDADPLIFSHTFPFTGVYAVEVAVWNCEMTEPVTDVVPVTVRQPGVCVEVEGLALALLTPPPLCAGEAAQFSADLTPDDLTRPYTYTVHLDGATLIYPQVGSSDPLTFSHTFLVSGSYVVEVAAWNCGLGEAGAVTGTVGVEVVEPGGYTVYLPVVMRND